MTVESINARRLQSLGAQFDDVMNGAVDVCLVTVKADGSVAWLLGDELSQAPALVGALEMAKQDIVSR